MIHSEIENKDRGASTTVKIFVSSVKLIIKPSLFCSYKAALKTQGVKTSFHRT